MSVQSTLYLTREQAEQLFVERYIVKHTIQFKAYAEKLSDEELQNYIETYFENFEITHQAQAGGEEKWDNNPTLKLEFDEAHEDRYSLGSTHTTSKESEAFTKGGYLLS